MLVLTTGSQNYKIQHKEGEKGIRVSHEVSQLNMSGIVQHFSVRLVMPGSSKGFKKEVSGQFIVTGILHMSNF